MKPILVSILALAACGSEAEDAIDRIVNAALQKSHTPGASIAIVQNGELLRIKGYGLADLENGVPAAPDTVYELGSITKQFTATVVMMLRDEGKLQLDEKICKLMSDLPTAWDKVTVRNLLTHTSGIKNYTEIPSFQAKMVQRGSESGLVQLVMNEKLQFEPGAKWSYSNTNYFILGMLIERLTGRNYREELQTRIFKPLGMGHTDLYQPNELVPHRARGYQPGRNGMENAPYIDMNWPFAAGSLMSSATDMAKWSIAQGSPRLLKPATWQEMWTAAKLNDGSSAPYGFGWMLTEEPGSRVISHGGAIPGFEADIAQYPSKHLGVIVLMNSLPSSPEDVAFAIAGHLDPSLAPAPARVIADPDPTLTRRLRKVFEGAMLGKADPSEFADTTRAVLFPDRILALTHLTDFGPLTGFKLTASEKSPAGTLLTYTAQYGSRTATVKFVVDGAGKIAGLVAKPD